MTLQQGSIVLVDVVSSAGDLRGAHPVVIVTPNEAIQAGELLSGPAISTKLQLAPRDHQVELPYGTPKARTGLNKPNAAVCSWLPVFRQADVIKIIGHTPSQHLAAILDRIEAIAQADPG